MEDFAPVVLFVYDRLDNTKNIIKYLQSCKLAKQTKLIIFSDGAKSSCDESKVYEVRTYIKRVTGFKMVNVIERANNWGLSKSIISGVSEIISNSGKVIVLEDDLKVSPSFLIFMNQALNFYEKSTKVWSISGFSMNFKFPEGYAYDTTFGIRASSWGWATWKNRWDKVDWTMANFQNFSKDKNAIKRFNKGGSDMYVMLKNHVEGKINSWAIRFCYFQFLNQMLDVFPVKSQIENHGISKEATNTKNVRDRFKTELDIRDIDKFKFPKKEEVIGSVLKQFQFRNSIWIRLKYKLLAYLG